MMSRLDWTGMEPFLLISIAAIASTGWQARVDPSVFARYFAVLDPTLVMAGAMVIGGFAIAYLQGTSEFAFSGPGSWTDALVVVVRAVPLFAASAIGADIVFRYPEDMNVAMPHALRFYPAIAVFMEAVVHALPIAVLVGIFGMPTGLDSTFWRIAAPVALIEAVLQAFYATSIGTSIAGLVQLSVFGVVQVWVFWRFGFVWMLGFRLAYYAIWHGAWGAARLELLF